MIEPYYQESGITIYHADCRDVLPHLGAVDLVLTDPPYGIGFDFQAKRSRKTGLDFGVSSRDVKRDPAWSMVVGDDLPFDPSPWLKFPAVVLWGANNYADKLPPCRGWLVWDKLGDKNPCAFGDCELAWTNRNMSIRIHRQLWRGLVREGEENVANGSKYHPCQKPIRLMRWCLSFFPDSITVLDPFMGSGTTLVAAKQLGRKAIGIEIEKKYCEIAIERLRQEVIPLPMPEPTDSENQAVLL
ncbi:MAG: site-specific DNA-methyltransferase [Dehalococcoidia bacterium]|jgi:DNA modification methylase